MTRPQAASTRAPADWSRRLDAFFKERHYMPFIRGQNDCIMLACDWIARLGYEDLAAPYRGTYGSLPGAARALIAFGAVIEEKGRRRPCVERCGALIAERLGLPEVGPGHVGRGDLAFVSGGNEFGGALAVCTGRSLMMPGLSAQHAVMLPIGRGTRAWRLI